jgi:hypothetical protein
MADWEDVDGGWENVGWEDVGPARPEQKVFSGVRDTFSNAKTPSLEQAIQGPIMAAGDLIGGIPGFVAGLGAGVGSAIWNLDPSKGLQTFKDVSHAMMPSSIAKVEPSVQGNSAYDMPMLPITAISDVVNTAAQG